MILQLELKVKIGKRNDKMRRKSKSKEAKSTNNSSIQSPLSLSVFASLFFCYCISKNHEGQMDLASCTKKWVAMQILVFSTAHPSIDCKKFREILRGCGLKLELFDWKEIELNDSNYALNSPNLQRLLTKWFRKHRKEFTTHFFLVF